MHLNNCFLFLYCSGGQLYDTPINPQSLGSGGGNSGSTQGGAGGGFIYVAGGNIFVYGYISANGLPGESSPTSQNAGGGGSGGTINVNAQNMLAIANTAVISANGGNGGVAESSGGGGSGGRIFVNATNIPFSGSNFTVAGGTTKCFGVIPNGTLTRKCTPGLFVFLP
jgi:hypothetical protein